ncbi:histidine kinase [Actinokineospora auranticolor]|uniref:sensor histidine kinase n=1 Tax=Actinokineospora auranticolor TaxID=155976 RepID=UPI0015E2EB90|nr:histidine kinase [Actinokineospora auranticolor]
MSRSRGIEPVVLGAVAVLGCFLPRDAPSRHMWEWAGIGTVPPLVSSAVLAALCLVAFVVRPRWPLYVVAAVAWSLRSLWPPLVVASYSAAVGARRPGHVFALTVAGTALAVLPEYVGVGVSDLPPSMLVTSFGSAALFVWLPAAVGLWVSARRQAVAAALEAVRRQATEFAEKVRRVRGAERARIARDLHDVVAHRVSLMVLHAGALEVNARDPETADAAGLIRSTGREALSQLRDVLGLLNADDEPGERRPAATLSDVDELVARSRAAGVPVTRRDEGEPRDLPLVVEHAGYRVVQEALTNVHKHAGSAETEVVLRYSAAALEIEVGNRAGEPADPLPGSGLGLVGLRERVELLGGEFTAGPRPDGFVVSARIPVRAR